MRSCPTCQSSVSADDAFCGNCGATLPGESPTVTMEASPAVRKPPAPPRKPVGEIPAGSGEEAPIDIFGDATLLGSGEPNATYLGQRLQWDAPEYLDLSEQLHAATRRNETRVLALMFFFFPGLPAVVVLSRIFGTSFGFLCSLALILVCAFIWFSPLLKRHYFPINEWKITLDGEAGHLREVFEHIANAVVRRQPPLEIRVVRLPGQTDYLNLRMGHFEGFITTLGYGNDLYIGWSLWGSGTWRDLRGGQRGMLATLVGLPYWVWLDIKHSRSSESMDVAQLHSYDVLKAMRECLHSVTREGVQAAVGSVPFAGQGTIGSVIPVGPNPAFASLIAADSGAL